MKELVQLKDIFDASQVDWGSLVDFFGLDIEYSSIPRGSGATRLFNDHGHGSTFVQKPKFTLGVAPGGRIAVNAAIDQNVVKIGHERTDISSGGPL